MKVAPISVEYIGHYGTDASVANAARVSFHKMVDVSAPLTEKDERLIKYLAKHEHKSPFNHCFLSFRVKAPIFCARQMVKHKFLPWNEVSRRYVDDEPEFYFPYSFREKATDKKQGSGAKIDKYTQQDADDYTKACVKHSLFIYNKLLYDGVCPEQARMFLPQNTMTEWIWSGTLGAFCDMLRLRLKPDTQEETRQVAELISNHISKLFPVSYGALLNE